MSHEINRKVAVADMANLLVVETGKRMPRYSYRSVVERALAFACELTDPQWLELGQRSGHYSNGDQPNDETTAAVLRLLESMLPTDTPADPFAGIS